MQDESNLLNIGGASEYLGVSIDTLRRWQKKGKLIAFRSPGGHRYFSRKDLDKVFGKKYERTEPTIRKITQLDSSKETLKKEPVFSPIEIAFTHPIPPWRATSASSHISKEIKIPQIVPVKIITEEKLISLETQTVSSILSPITEVSPTSPKPSISLENPRPLDSSDSTQDKPARNQKTTPSLNWRVIAAFSAILFIFIGFILFVLWKSSQTLLSPIP